MITKAQAMSFGYRKELWHKSLKNSDDTPVRCRVNGQCKTWVTRPDEFRLPVKHGLKQTFYITEDNAGDWYDPSERPTMAENEAQWAADYEKEQSNDN